MLEAVEKSFSKHDKELQPKKALLIPMWKQARRWVAMNGGRITEVREDETHCLWNAKNNKYRIGDTPLPIHQSAKLLGKLVGPSPERHTNQTGWARKKTKSAIKTMGWMGAFAKETDNRVVHMLYTYLVESVIVNAVLNTHLNERDYKECRRAQTEILRRATGVGARCSPLALLREFGWKAIDARIWSSKIGLHEAIKALPQREYARHVLGIRMNITRTGVENKGLCAETLELWRRADSEGSWDATHEESKATRKRRIKPIIHNLLELQWQEWCEEKTEDNGQYHCLCPEQGTPAEHISNGTKKQVALMATTRMGGCILRGNKTAPEGWDSDRKECTLCDQKTWENETHLLLECNCYNTERREMLATFNDNLTEVERKVFDRADKNLKRLILLGMKMHNGDTDKERRTARDSAVKRYLQAVNDLRKETHGLADLCGKAMAPVEGTLAETQMWEEEARQAITNLQGQGLLVDEDEGSALEEDNYC